MKEPFSVIRLRKDTVFRAQQVISNDFYFLNAGVFHLFIIG